MRRFFERTRRLGIWYHSSFRLPFSSMLHDTGLDPRRADNVLTWLLDRRLLKPDGVYEAPEASYPDLRRVHTDAWLARLDEPEVVAGLLGLEAAMVPVESMVELWRRGCGATLEAVRWVLDNDGIAATLMGGFHHAGPNQGSGFCGLNDIAVAVAAIRSEGFAGPILVIDLDAHPPDGLVEFELDGVEVRSVGVASDWKAEGGLDLRVPPQTEDGPYLEAVDQVLEDLGPIELAIYLAGSDPLKGDPLGNLAVSEAGLRERDRRVFDALQNVPTVVIPGGGYTPKSWRVLAGSIAAAVGSHESVRPAYDPVARRVGRVARQMAPLEDDGPLITEEDLGFGPRPRHRFLGYYTRHGLELVASRYGIVDALTRMGFEDPRIDVRDSTSPHQLRVFARAGEQVHRVIDISLTFRSIEGSRTLFVEWLELQDPRYPSDARSLLPGQQFRGLGLAREIANMLLVAAARLGVAGVSFVPSHYHVAWIARTHATFVDPHARGRFRALRQFLERVPLSEASAVLAGPGLPTEDGDTIRWEPTLMVHALDDSLREHIRTGEAEAKSFEKGTLFRLLPASVTFPKA